MIKLPKVTLIALTGLFYKTEEHKKAIENSCKGIEFGDVKLINDGKIKTIDDWNKAVIYDLHKYIDTEFCLLIHSDGYVINPELWNPRWLRYDYIGAPWPLPQDDYSYRTETGELIRVGNGVSLRSKKLCALPTMLKLPWQSYYGNTNEDGFLCVHNKYILERYGCKFAPLEVAKYFSKEHEIEDNRGIETFVFHAV